MHERSVGFALSGVFLASALAFVAPGCGHSLEGDYLRLCKESCSAFDDCENFTKVVVDREKCERDCDNDADNYAANVDDQCGRDYEIDSEQVDRCSSALSMLGDACRNNDKGDYTDSSKDYFDECVTETFVTCK